MSNKMNIALFSMLIGCLAYIFMTIPPVQPTIIAEISAVGGRLPLKVLIVADGEYDISNFGTIFKVKSMEFIVKSQYPSVVGYIERETAKIKSISMKDDRLKVTRGK